MTAGTCRFCECTESTPCPGGCAWTDDSQTLCTVCMEAAAIAGELVRALNGGDWDALDVEQQGAIVDTCRRHLDAVQIVITTELGEDARQNAEAIDEIAAYIIRTFPDEVEKARQTSFSDIVIGLLKTSTSGSRIVVP